MTSVFLLVSFSYYVDFFLFLLMIWSLSVPSRDRLAQVDIRVESYRLLWRAVFRILSFSMYPMTIFICHFISCNPLQIFYSKRSQKTDGRLPNNNVNFNSWRHQKTLQLDTSRKLKLDRCHTLWSPFPLTEFAYFQILYCSYFDRIVQINFHS